MIDVKMEDRWIEEKIELDIGWVRIVGCVLVLFYYIRLVSIKGFRIFYVFFLKCIDLYEN